jgi:hypothetical protein
MKKEMQIDATAFWDAGPFTLVDKSPVFRKNLLSPSSGYKSKKP